MGVFFYPHTNTPDGRVLITHTRTRPLGVFFFALTQSKPVASKKERPNLPVFGILVYVPTCASMGIARRGL